MTARMFAAVLEHGPAWADERSLREQEGWVEHAAFMDELVADGFIVLGGPIGDGARVLHAVFAPDEATVRARLEADPWYGPMLRIVSVEPWTVLLDGRSG